ncbi:hypothetical protein JVT61DRAFT_12901 [Boletus reticuloceps]|uniref:Uncharacterized protein n=1 Tax=Boletus reticuloceps TaxID=495285 RepID=A0A8I3AB42_9AGAM|nr:hypothetical protein JVT61DRAFT_12901 [Boletus reticuloceps]
MTDDDAEPPNAVVHTTQGPKEPSPRAQKENGTDMNQPPPSNPPETPTPPPGGTVKSTRAPEPMTLSERHQAALRHIHALEGHNAKLYDDNCRLVNAVNMLNDRLAFLGAPQNTQVLRLMDMQEKLRAGEASRALINRKYQELLQSTFPASVLQHHINEELHAVREAYASLDKEYRLLGDKYNRLRAVADASRVAHQHSQGTVPPELANTTQFRPHGQHRNSYPSPTSVISPGPLQPFPDQNWINRRHSSEGTMVQQSLRSGPTPIATTWLAPLPTPPPSAPVHRGQTSPTGFPLHAPVPAGSLLLPHHPQIAHEPPALSALPAVAQSRYLQQGTSEQPNAAMYIRLPRGEIMDYDQQRTSFMYKATKLSIPDFLPSPPAPTDPQHDHKLSVADSNLRSYQECVNFIFEKDADVENGVFCGLCLDRHEAKMIPEPPDVLVQPDFDFLLRHCMTMHPTVWDDLRRGA